MLIRIGESTFKCEIKRSKRKSIELRLPNKGRLLVKAPNRLSDDKIKDFILTRSDWIQRMNSRSTEEISYRDGMKLMFLGKEYTLVVKKTLNRRSTVGIDGEQIIIRANNVEPDNLKSDIQSFYRMRLKNIVATYVKKYAQVLGVSYNRITIKGQQTRWGSCSSKNNLNFNFRLAMADESIIEYVVVHEVCHLVHLNHSEEFWRLVEKLLPDYRVYRDWLKDNGSKLMSF